MAEVTFYGDTFHVTETPNEFALMEFSDTAERVEESSMPALAALFRLLQDSIAANPADVESTPDREWDRFRAVARKNRASSETLLPVVFAVFSQATERPTVLPSDSSGGLESTPLRSVSPPADPAMDRLSGRPDLQLALVRSRPAVAVSA